MTDLAEHREDLIEIPIDRIIPYWRNPRNASESDIGKIMVSIETYGYQNPIMVDRENVIILGHTRYLALRRLGWKTVPVLVSDLEPQAAREYRIIDNRAGEFTTWDRNILLEELQRFTQGNMVGVFFPEVSMEYTPLDDIPTLNLPPMPEQKDRSNKPSRTVICWVGYCGGR